MKKTFLLLWVMTAIASAQTASVQVDANGTVLNFQSPSTKAINYPTGKLEVNGVQITGLESDASATVKGVTKLSVTPASSSNPIAVGDNDSRNTNARTPTAHASSHASAGSDPVTLIISQITGLQSALDLKAPLASPSFTGVPLSPTAAIDTNTTQIATTGFVLAQAANATPIVASTGAVGTSTRYARQDHVHPAQTSVTGNAGTATALQTARTINGVSFDGTANITLPVDVSDTAYASSWNGVTATAPSQNAVYDIIHSFDTDDDGKVNVLDQSAGIPLTDANGVLQSPITDNSSNWNTAYTQRVTTLSLTTPNVLYATPVTFSDSSGAWTGTLSLNTQTANTVFAGPTTGSAATPTMRALVFADLPSISSANLRTLLSDENGTGADLFNSATSATINFAQTGLTLNGGDTNAVTLKINETETAARILNLKLHDADRTVDLTGDLTLANSFTTSGNFALTLTQTATTNVTLPTTGTLATLAGSEAFTNKNLSGAGNTFPTFNQNTTGSAATLTTARAIYGNNFDGSAALAQIIASTYGGTGNGFTKFSGPTTSEKTKTVRDATDTILELGGSYTPTGTWTNLTLVTPALGTPASGVVTNLTGTASININGTVGATTAAAGTFTTIVANSTTSLLLGTAGTSVGNIGFRNATSGTATLAPPTGALGTYTVTLPNAASTLPIFGQQITFSGPTAARTVTFPDASFTVARTDAANTFTGAQTMTSPVISGTSTSITNVGTFALRDTSAAFDLTITATSGTALSAARTLTLDVGNVAHTIAFGTTANTITFPNAASGTVPFLNLAQTWTALQSFGTNLGGTLQTAAQPNVTSLGNLTSLTVSGDISLFGTTTAPSTDSSYAILAVGPNQTIQGFHTLQATSTLLISQNASYASGSTWKYISTDLASNYYQTSGAHVMRVAPSGTAGNAITWTDILTIDGSRATFGKPAKLKAYTVSTLPTGSQGDTAYVTDALTPTFLAVVVGGGSTVAPVFYNGTNWVGY